MKKILITGATGFIGSHLVARNLAEKNDIKILVRADSAKVEYYKQQGIEVVYGNIQDQAAVEQAVRDVEIVFHAAGVVTDWAPRKLFEDVNIFGTELLCSAAQKENVQRFVFVSTSDVFGIREDIIIDESLEYRYWHELYPDTKIDASNIVWKYQRQGLRTTIVYPCWVYGPEDRTFVPLLADAIRKKELVFWRRNAIVWPAYVENVVDLLLVVANHPRAIGEGFLVHDGVSDTFEKFSAKIATELGLPEIKLHIPYKLAYSMAWAMEYAWKIFCIKMRPVLTTYATKNLGSRLQFSIEKAKQLLDWSPPVPYETAFSTTMNWLKSQDPGEWKVK